MEAVGVFNTIGSASYILVETKSIFNNPDERGRKDLFILVPLDEIELRRFPNRDLQIISPYLEFVAITPQTEEETFYLEELRNVLPILHKDDHAIIYGKNEAIKNKNDQNRRKRGIAPLIEGL